MRSAVAVEFPAVFRAAPPGGLIANQAAIAGKHRCFLGWFRCLPPFLRLTIELIGYVGVIHMTCPPEIAWSVHSIKYFSCNRYIIQFYVDVVALRLISRIVLYTEVYTCDILLQFMGGLYSLCEGDG